MIRCTLYVQLTAAEEKLAAETEMRQAAEQAFDRERRSFQMASISSGSGMHSACCLPSLYEVHIPCLATTSSACEAERDSCQHNSTLSQRTSLKHAQLYHLLFKLAFRLPGNAHLKSGMQVCQKWWPT